MNTETSILIHKPVVLLGELELELPPKNVSESFDIVAKLNHGSDFTCQVEFGDDQTDSIGPLHGMFILNKYSAEMIIKIIL